MLYEVKLAQSELDVLTSLIGRPLDLVAADGWAAELHSGNMVLGVVPEEVGTPDSAHPDGDVERPLIKTDGISVVSPHLNLMVEALGCVRAVNVVSALIGYTPVVVCPAQEFLHGVMLPETLGYGWIYYQPAERSAVELRVTADQALIDLDIAFELVTDRCSSLVVYTRGFFVEVSMSGLPADTEWVRFGTFMRRPLGKQM